MFDLGGVIVDWNPRYLYRKLIDDPAEMDRFLTEVCSPAWNLEQDRGRSFEEAVDLLSREHPKQAALIKAYWQRWPEMLGGLIPGASAVLSELHERDVPIFAITNWSAQTFPLALERYPVLNLFDEIIVSGEVGVIKPDIRIYEIALERFGINQPSDCLFVDDSVANVSAAVKAGMHAVQFTTVDALRDLLSGYGLLSSR